LCLISSYLFGIYSFRLIVNLRSLTYTEYLKRPRYIKRAWSDPIFCSLKLQAALKSKALKQQLTHADEQRGNSKRSCRRSSTRTGRFQARSLLLSPLIPRCRRPTLSLVWLRKAVKRRLWLQAPKTAVVDLAWKRPVRVLLLLQLRLELPRCSSACVSCCFNALLFKAACSFRLQKIGSLQARLM
jgi:hypothetical protein